MRALDPRRIRLQRPGRFTSPVSQTPPPASTSFCRIAVRDHERTESSPRNGVPSVPIPGRCFRAIQVGAMFASTKEGRGYRFELKNAARSAGCGGPSISWCRSSPAATASSWACPTHAAGTSIFSTPGRPRRRKRERGTGRAASSCPLPLLNAPEPLDFLTPPTRLTSGFGSEPQQALPRP